MNREGFLVRDLQTGKLYPCRPGEVLQVGRRNPDDPPDLSCEDPHVSRHHCQLRCAGDALEVSDASSSGTFLNGERVDPAGRAQAGDRLTLGHDYALVVLSLDPGDPETLAATAPPPGAQPAGGPASSPLPREVGGYAILRTLGHGQSGTVYQARCSETGREFAVKALAEFTEAEVRGHVMREAHLATLLDDSPALVPIRDWGASDEGSFHGQPAFFVARDYLDESLGSRIRAGLPLETGVALVAEVARVLHFAHTRDVTHGNLTPDKVLLTRDGQPRLIGFRATAPDDKGRLFKLRRTPFPNYMAPERILDETQTSPAADLYGLGGLLYTVITRRPPFPGRVITKVIRQVLKGAVVPPRVHVPDLDPVLEALCLAALDSVPAGRPESADALARSLEDWLRGQRGDSETVKLRPSGC